MRTTAHRPFSRDQRTTIVYGMLAFVLIIVILQLWLLTATMNAWLGGDDSVVLPAAAANESGDSLPAKAGSHTNRDGWLPPSGGRLPPAFALKRQRARARSWS